MSSRLRYLELIGLSRHINNFVSAKKQLGGARHVAFNIVERTGVHTILFSMGYETNGFSN